MYSNKLWHCFCYSSRIWAGKKWVVVTNAHFLLLYFFTTWDTKYNFSFFVSGLFIFIVTPQIVWKNNVDIFLAQLQRICCILKYDFQSACFHLSVFSNFMPSKRGTVKEKGIVESTALQMFQLESPQLLVMSHSQMYSSCAYNIWYWYLYLKQL